MSQDLSQGKGRRPPPQSVEIAPRFSGSGLPQSPEVMTSHLHRQLRDERRARSQAAQEAAKECKAPPAELCQTALHLSLFFDGTNNNEPADKRFEPRSTSNVARLYHATVDHSKIASVDDGDKPPVPGTPTYFSYYCPGVGTVFPEIGENYPDDGGLKYATGGENRINWGLTRLIDALKKALSIDGLLISKTQELIEQMSTLWPVSNGQANREAAMRPEIEQLEQLLVERKQKGTKPEILALRLYVYGFSRGAAEARALCNWLHELVQRDGEYHFAGLPISIEFLGLFDTVAAVGFADSVPFAAGHMSWADGTMRLPDGDTRLPDDPGFLRRCVHLVSAHEQRASFPLDSIRRCDRLANSEIDRDGQSRYRSGSVEFVYPGMHSDVGGGYPPGDQGKAMEKQGLLMSQVTLHHMYKEAFAVGAPLQVPAEALGCHEAWRLMNEESQAEFAVDDALIARFNSWQAQAANAGRAPLETVVERETELITGWRIDRYHGGVDKTGFYKRTSADESDAAWDARVRLHQHKHDEMKQKTIRTCEQRLAGEPLQPNQTDCCGYSSSNPLSSHSVDQDIQTIGGLEEYRKIKIEKLYEPTLDRRQLEGAAKEFSRDYKGDWGPVSDEGIVSALFTTISGVVYLINEEDEAKQYHSIHDNGEIRFAELFAGPGQIARGQENLVALFDDHAHDSRAWFMNSSGAGPREPWTDYFRYRLVHFDHESNKSLTPLLTAGRVIGLAIAVGSIGLAVKRRDPRYLLGLILPTLGVPVIRGKLPMPEASGQSLPQVSAFDPLTGIAYPMMEGIDHLRAYTREPGTVLRQVAAMPPPQPLTEQTATTPELQTILKAAQAAKAVAEAKEGNPMGLVDMLAEQLNDTEQPDKSQSPDWLDMAGDMLGKKMDVS